MHERTCILRQVRLPLPLAYDNPKPQATAANFCASTPSVFSSLLFLDWANPYFPGFPKTIYRKQKIKMMVANRIIPNKKGRRNSLHICTRTWAHTHIHMYSLPRTSSVKNEEEKGKKKRLLLSLSKRYTSLTLSAHFPKQPAFSVCQLFAQILKPIMLYPIYVCSPTEIKLLVPYKITVLVLRKIRIIYI